MEKYQLMIEQLKNREIEKIEITKEEFLQFRELIVKDEMFKHFKGEAQQGGNVIYTFLDVPRS